jgi:molybdopterin/thiamine biosynthesis adenylyltransferase
VALSDLIRIIPSTNDPPAAGAERSRADLASAPATTFSAPPIRVEARETAPDSNGDVDDRFQRFKLIGWWDQSKLARAKVLVVGAGALGNEIVKNLALLGVGQVLIVDMDRIENSNLSRSVLYRATDNGSFKSQAAARAARDIYPGIRSHALVANAVYDLGMGVYRWADVVMGGLDNREARLSINRACLKVGRPWIDGAIEQIQGTARVFTPDGPCYECTMSDTDWRLLQMRRSCNLLTRGEMEAGKTPTTPTISSIIAGVQCQEMLKLLHGLETIHGKGWVFDGLSTEAYPVQFQRKESCYSHDPLDEIVSLEAGSQSVSLGDLLVEAKKRLGPEAELEFGRDVLERLVCPRCKDREEMFVSLGRVPENAAWCPACRRRGEEVRREVVTFYKVRGDEPFLDRSPAGVGLPPLDIVIARNPARPGRSIGLELSWDAKDVLGPLWDGEALEWA